ncbi:MAG: hypothetical protein MR874_10425 [Coriobacteriaceae bacterium]|nr:hypothetical protein [Coriobacteriaceae bacterium]MDD7583648.1 hypothetical protein [Coriobacteriaceae bacterium]
MAEIDNAAGGTGWARRGVAALKRALDVREGRASRPQIRKRFVGGSKLDGTHMCILIVAMLIASIGLNTDSAEAIVGAMLICPLMGSVLAISYAVATADMRLPRFAGALYEFGVNVVFIALAAEVVLLLLHVPLHRDVNDDGVVTPQESEEAVAISRHLRRNVIIGTLVFAIPCLVVTTGVVQETVQQRAMDAAEAPSQASDQYETALTTQELKAVQPEVERYSVGAEYSYAANSSQPVERIVATVASSRELSADERVRATALVRIHVPGVDEVRFTADGSCPGTE